MSSEAPRHVNFTSPRVRYEAEDLMTSIRTNDVFGLLRIQPESGGGNDLFQVGLQTEEWSTARYDDVVAEKRELQAMSSR